MKEYKCYEHEGRERQIEPSFLYRAVEGVISRVQVKSLDVRVGKEEEVHFIELTVTLGDRLPALQSDGLERTLKLKSAKSISGLMADLGAATFNDLLCRRVLVHHDASCEPVYFAVSHPDYSGAQKVTESEPK